MTTSKPYHGPSQPVAFSKPTIGPRVYLVEGSSGWTETFNRKLADKAVEAFLDPLLIDDVLETFDTAMELEARPENWEDVINFLGKVTQQSAKLIPEIVGVGFWALLQQREQQKGTN